MERYVYLAVRVIAATYLMYKVWKVLFKKRLFGMWDRIPVHRPRNQSEARSSVPAHKDTARLVGRAHGSYLAAPAPALEPVPVIPVAPEPDSDAEPDDQFEVGPDMGRPSDEELYGSGNEQPQVTDFSTGRTYEQLTEAVDYIAAPVEDDEIMMRTAETLSMIRGSDLFEFIELQVGDTDLIGRIMADCLDGNGKRLPKRRSKMTGTGLISFDIGNYV
jgi:hypothetical protein